MLNENTNDIKLQNINTKNDKNTFTVNIKNSNEIMLEAHNTNKEAHKNILNEIINKTEALMSTINELEENIVLPSDIPTKISNLENDLNFVSETTMADALEKRQVVNLGTLNEKITQTTSEIQAAINERITEINTRLDEMGGGQTGSGALDTETISSQGLISLTAIIPISPTNGLEYVAPANGVIVGDFTGSATNSYLTITRNDSASYYPGQSCYMYTKGYTQKIEMYVNKNETIQMDWENGKFEYVGFHYLNGSAPKDEQSEEA